MANGVISEVNRYGKAIEMFLTNYQFYRLNPI